MLIVYGSILLVNPHLKKACTIHNGITLNLFLSWVNEIFVFLAEHWFFIAVDFLYIDLPIFAAEAMNQLVRTLFKIENQSLIV